MNRKKILLLVNDLTYFPIVLVGIDAQTKKRLNAIIPQAIREVFQAAEIPQKKVEEYLDLAGAIEVNKGYNRVVTGVTTNMIASFNYSRIIRFGELVDVQTSIGLADSIYKNIHPIDELKKAFENPLSLQEVTVDEIEEKEYVVKRNWKSLHDFKTEEFSDEVAEKAQANNKLILQAFQEYLEQHDKLAKKTVRRHVDNAAFYLNGYLIFYGYNLAVTTFDVIEDFFSWGARKGAWYSEAAAKQTGGSLKKFYRFLLAAGEVKEANMPEIRESIEMGIEDANMTLFMMESMYDEFD